MPRLQVGHPKWLYMLLHFEPDVPHIMVRLRCHATGAKPTNSSTHLVQELYQLWYVGGDGAHNACILPCLHVLRGAAPGH